MVAIIILLLVGLFLGGIFYILYDYYKKYTPRKVYKLYLDFIGIEDLGPYYVSLAEKYDINPPKDELGAITYTHYLTGTKAYVHPIRNTHVAYAYYENYILHGDKEDLQRFFDVVDAFIRHQVRLDNGSVIWYYPPYKYFPGQQTPWTSAMSQGQMIGVLARAYKESGKQEYLDLAIDVLKSFEHTIEEGGVRYIDKYGIFYEEFAYWEEGKRNHTLNGMLSALFGIYDLWKVSGNETARQVFDTGVNTIKSSLILYDQTYCSSYDLRHLVSKDEFILLQGRYNAVHVGHLKILSRMTGDDFFLAYSELWDQKLKDPWNRFRLTLWYVNYKLNDFKMNVRDFGFFGALKVNFDRFLKKKPMI